MDVEAADAMAVDSTADANGIDAANAADTGPVLACDITRDFGVAKLVLGLESQELFSARLTADGLTMYYAATTGAFIELLQAARPALDAGFAPAGKVAGVNTGTTTQYWPTLSADGLVIFFESDRTLKPDDAGVYQEEISRIWTSSRSKIILDFGPPDVQSLFQIEAGLGLDSAPYLHPSGRSLYFASSARGGAGGLDVFVATINASGVVTSVDNITAVNTPNEDHIPVVSADELSLYFSQPDVGNDDSARNIMVSRRKSTQDAWGAPTKVASLDTAFDEFPSFPTADGCQMIFISNRPTPTDPPDAGPGKYHAWIATRP